MSAPSPEEQARIDEIRAKMGDPPDGVEVHLEYLDPDEIVERIAAEEAMTFLRPAAFGWYKPPGLHLLPAIELAGGDWLELAVRESRVSCDAYGIGNAIEGVEVPLFAQFRLKVKIRGKIVPDETPILIWIDDAPEEWLARAMVRFCLVWPERPTDDGGSARSWIATGRLNPAPGGVVVPPKLGRNDPCPCNSGKKFKRCHGR